MRQTVKVVELDRSEQGMALTALSEYRNQQIRDGQQGDLANDLIEKLFCAPTRKKKGRARNDPAR